VKALADLAKEDVPENVNIAYNKKNLTFGKEYLIPKPLDPRLITRVAVAVAKAAMDSGVARKPILDWDKYSIELEKRMGLDNALIRSINSRAKSDPKRVLYGQAENFRVLKAVQAVKQQGIAEPILMGNREEIMRLIEENKLDLEDVPIIDILSNDQKERRRKFAQVFCDKRKRNVG